MDRGGTQIEGGGERGEEIQECEKDGFTGG